MNKTSRTFFKTMMIGASFCALTALTGCSKGNDENKVLIYTSAEDYRVEDLKKVLTEQFPDYDITIDYRNTGSHAASLLAEGADTEADITFDLEYPYLNELEEAGAFADLSEYDTSDYVDDGIVSDYYLPECRNGGAIIVNREVLEEKGLDVPTSYEDLLKPEYKGLISMPNPKSSGTGYMFLKALVNEMGEDEAFEYFDKLNDNILSYTSSGSGPVTALKNKEAAIGLGMTSQAVYAINEGAPLDILFFEDGSPYSLYGQAIIKGKETKKAVKDVFDYMITDYSKRIVEQFYPEPIFKDMDVDVKNYPSNIKYADMSNNTPDEKDRLLEKWKY